MEGLDVELFVKGLIRVIRLFIVPYSCWLHKICRAYADCGLSYLVSGDRSIYVRLFLVVY